MGGATTPGPSRNPCPGAVVCFESEVLLVLFCPSCGSEVDDEHASPELGMAQCPSCENVFELGESPERPESEPSRAKDLTLAMPEGIELTETSDALAMTYTWSRVHGVMLGVFSVLWWGFLSFWYARAMGSGNLIMLLFPLIHVSMGVGVAYTALAHFVNKSTVLVNPGVLAIEIGPLPWPGTRKLPTQQLRQLYVKKVVHRNKNGTTITYDLRAETTKGDVKLLGGFPQVVHAKFMERAIEDKLGIVDRRHPDQHD